MLYNDEGNEYPVDDFGQLYVPLRYKQSAVEEGQEENEKLTKKLKRSYASVVNCSTCRNRMFASGGCYALMVLNARMKRALNQ